MITAYLPHRGIDGWGSGDFGAPRGDRKHRGLDYEVAPGSIICSPVTGEITKLGYAYSDDPSYRYIEIRDDDNNHHRFFYIEPAVAVGWIVPLGNPLGASQDIAARYSKPHQVMKNHVHWSVLKAGGTRGVFDDYISPEDLLS